MTKHDATVAALMAEMNEEARLLVKAGGKWEIGTWETLFGVLKSEAAEITEGSILGLVKYTQAAGVLVEYLGERPMREHMVILHAHIGAQLRKMLAALREVREMSDVMMNGIPRLEETGFTHEQLLRMFYVSIESCTAHRDRIAPFVSGIHPFDAYDAVWIRKRIADKRSDLYDGFVWKENAFVLLWELLTQVRYGVQTASPFAVMEYAGMLDLAIQFFGKHPDRVQRKAIRDVVEEDLRRLNNRLGLHPVYTRYQKETLFLAKDICRAHLSYLNAIVGRPGTS